MIVGRLGYGVVETNLSSLEEHGLIAGLGILARLLRVTEPDADLLSDSLLGLGQILGLIIRRGVEVDAVCACVALDVGGVHGRLRGRWVLQLTHGSILPWILTTVQEEDVVSLDVEATVEFVGLVSSCLDLCAEDPITVIGPEIHVDRVRAERLLVVGRLEEAELSAVLPGPLATGSSGVDLRVTESYGVISIVGDATVLGELNNRCHKGVLVSGRGLQLLTHADASAVLDTCNKDVGIEEEKVRVVDWDSDIEQVRDVLVTLVGFELMLSDHDGRLDGVAADWARLVRPHEDIQIESLEVLDGVDNTRGRPSADSVGGILRLEPGSEGARIASTNYNPVGFVSELVVLVIDEMSNVSKCLLRVQVAQVLSLPRVERLRFTVVAMLKGVEKTTVLSANHHRVHMLIGRGARPLTANVEEYGDLFFRASVLIIEPVALLVSAIVLVIEVVDFVLEPVRGVVIHCHTQLHFEWVGLGGVRNNSQAGAQKQRA